MTHRDIETINTAYAIANDKVSEFLEENPIHEGILLQAIEPLRSAFGVDKTFRLELVHEDGEASIHCVILWPGSVQSAASSLDAFDENWWLDHMNPKAYLVFTYQLT